MFYTIAVCKASTIFVHDIQSKKLDGRARRSDEQIECVIFFN